MAADGSALVANLLWARGIRTPEAAQAFLNLETYTPASSYDLPDMQAAVDRIIHAIEHQQSILIYGDFDVDGQTGTSVYWLGLRGIISHLGAEKAGAKVAYYIPDRAAEGHGLNSNAICRLVSQRQPDLLITTDTGITNFKEVSLLNGLGVETIVTDHHDLPEHLPPALANVNAKRLTDETHPLYHICGAGVAYKVLREVALHYGCPEVADNLLDIVAVGTIVDMVPLVGENRWLVWRGLQVLNTPPLRTGFSALLAEAGTDTTQPLTEETVGFTIGPRFNAVGRLQHCDPGVQLMTTTDPAEAATLAKTIEAINKRRQAMTEETVQWAEKHLLASGGLDGQQAIVLASPDWHVGVIGLVATRLKDRYNVPVFLLQIDQDAQVAKCSARSIAGFNLHSHLEALQHYFTHWGGHAGAGGFALPLAKLEAFKRDCLARAKAELGETLRLPELTIDATLDWDQLTPGLVDQVKRLSPFGMGNPSPVFALKDVVLGAQRRMGDSQQHAKWVLLPHAKAPTTEGVDAILWRADQYAQPELKTPFSVAIVPQLNTFNNTTRLQLMVQDVQVSQRAMATQTMAASTKSPQASMAKVSPISDVQTNSQTNLNDASPLATPASMATLPFQWVDHRQRLDGPTWLMQVLETERQALVVNRPTETADPTILLLGPQAQHPWLQSLPPLTGVVDAWVNESSVLKTDDYHQTQVLFMLAPPSTLSQLRAWLSLPSLTRVHWFYSQPMHGMSASSEWPLTAKATLKAAYLQWRSQYRAQQQAQQQGSDSLLQADPRVWAEQWGCSPETALVGASVLQTMQLVHWHHLSATEAIGQLLPPPVGSKMDVEGFPLFRVFEMLWQQDRDMLAWYGSAPLAQLFTVVCQGPYQIASPASALETPAPVPPQRQPALV